jgi:hypothetical protein
MAAELSRQSDLAAIVKARGHLVEKRHMLCNVIIALSHLGHVHTPKAIHANSASSIAMNLTQEQRTRKFLSAL